MPRQDLKVFILSPTQPAGPPRPGPTLTVDARTLDGLLTAAQQALTEAGFPQQRSISFTPTGLVAYVVANE